VAVRDVLIAERRARPSRHAYFPNAPGRAAAATIQTPAVDQSKGELEGARVSIVALLAVINDEQLKAVETALDALAPISDRARAARQELRLAREFGGSGFGEPHDVRRTIEARLAMPDQRR
jgi:hypothetical protein